MALFGVTPALASDFTLQYSAAEQVAQPAAAEDNDELARQLEKEQEALRQADPDAAADRDAERQAAEDQRAIQKLKNGEPLTDGEVTELARHAAPEGDVAGGDDEPA